MRIKPEQNRVEGRGALRPGGDLPEHLGHVMGELTLWYSWGGKKHQWRSGQMALQSKPPKEDADVIVLAGDLGRATARELFRRPMASQRRVVA